MFEPFVCAAMEEEIRWSNYSHGPNHKLSRRIFEKLLIIPQYSDFSSSLLYCLGFCQERLYQLQGNIREKVQAQAGWALLW
jgi:hypothetical protein